jgi:phosphate transport system protein
LPRIHYQQQLAQLKEKLLAMATLTQQTMACAMGGYLKADSSLLSQVPENERAINTAERSMDEMAYELMAMEQPMAIDLRFLLAVVKINGDLERIGDQSVNIAERAARLIELPPAELGVDLRTMSDITSQMIQLALQSLLDGDAGMAKAVLGMDDDVDRMNREVHEAMVDLIQKRPEWAEQALSTIVIARNLERIADHATNIAEDVIFWIRGADVRHYLSVAVD